jgi:7-keto-8-aminopelargonate synthetase-like enzyme
MTPASCATALAALRHLESHPELPRKLLDISSYARACFHKKGVRIIEAETPIVPIYTYQPENTLIKGMQAYEAGVYVNPVLPPACPEGECLLRTSYMATHTKPLIDEATDILAKVLKEDA